MTAKFVRWRLPWILGSHRGSRAIYRDRHMRSAPSQSRGSARSASPRQLRSSKMRCVPCRPDERTPRRSKTYGTSGAMKIHEIMLAIWEISDCEIQNIIQIVLQREMR